MQTGGAVGINLATTDNYRRLVFALLQTTAIAGCIDCRGVATISGIVVIRVVIIDIVVRTLIYRVAEYSAYHQADQQLFIIIVVTVVTGTVAAMAVIVAVVVACRCL